MEVRTSAGKNGPLVSSPQELVEQLAAELRLKQQQWLQRLTQQPQAFADLEVTVHHTFQQLADQLVASLVAKASQQSAALDDAQKKK